MQKTYKKVAGRYALKIKRRGQVRNEIKITQSRIGLRDFVDMVRFIRPQGLTYQNT